jgi:peroxiredoxin
MARPLALLALVVIAVAGAAYYWLFQRPPAVPLVGRPAPAFQLPTLDGRPASLTDFRGRPVIVNFWATWCEPCKEEMPALQTQTDAHPELVVLGIDNVESAVKVRPFVEQLGIKFPILLDQDGSVVERYRVSGLPTTFFIDGTGILRFVYRGPLTAALLQQGLNTIGVAAIQTPTPSNQAGLGPLDQRDEPPLPQPREEGAAAAAGGKLYVMAGFDAAGKDTASVFVFDGHGWQAGPNLPVALDHPSAAAIGGEVFVAGGFSNGPAVAGAYRLSGDRWQAIAPLNHARGALALIALEGKLYALGGTAQAEVGPAEVYDPAANHWSDLPPLPAPRNHVAGFTFEGKPCIGGGRSPNTPRVDCFDPGTQAWQRLPDLPQPTSGGGGETVQGEPVVAGGEGERIIDQLARLSGGVWQFDRMRVPRHGLQLAVLNGRAYACGGGTSPGLNAVATCTSIG